MTVNGKPVSADVDPRTLLVDFLRRPRAHRHARRLRHRRSAARARSMIDGQRGQVVHVLAAQAQGATIVTIEGLAAADGTMHPMQAAFKDCHGLQCGFCTPGMVMSAIDLVQRHPKADEQTIRERARRQPVPLHRLSQHRQGGAAGCRRDGEVEGADDGCERIRVHRRNRSGARKTSAF